MGFQWEYEKRISELEAERENNYGMAYGRGYNAGCNDSKAMLEKALAERDQLAASLKSIEDADHQLAMQYEARLETARKALEKIRKETYDVYRVQDAIRALREIDNPSAALEERDREVARRTAERCAEIADSEKSAEIRREFGLEEK